MKERPILFSAPMVRRLLDGSKTQTRRVVKPAPNWTHPGLCCTETPEGWQGPMSRTEWAHEGDRSDGDLRRCPYGGKGDRLWVRETWAPRTLGQLPEIDRHAKPRYRATEDLRPEWGNAWKPSIHMPRWASRITLEVTGVRVERLQAISEADAKAEGLKALTKDGRTVKYGIPDRDGLPGNDDTGWHWSEWSVDPRAAYRRLWESINGPGSWDANPWVWVIEFKRVA